MTKKYQNYASYPRASIDLTEKLIHDFCLKRLDRSILDFLY